MTSPSWPVRTSPPFFGRFWRAVTEIAWFRYFGDRRETSFGLEDFDHYPKGTGCLLLRTELMRGAMAEFRSRVGDDRLVNDDTAVMRRIAEDHRIWPAPTFGCTYEPRTTAKGFFKQVFYRGTTFYDGFSVPGTRFTALVRAFPLATIAGVLVALRWPRTLLASALPPVASLAFALRRKVDAGDALLLSALSLPFAAVYSLGICRGVIKHRLNGGQEETPK
jgi:hypothetical protein